MKTLDKLSSDTDVIEYVSNFLLNQGKKSYGFDGGCRYRGGENNELKCAIGCLILDKFYHSSYEDQTVINYNVYKAVENSLPNYKINIELLQQLQNVHDSFEEQDWEWKFSRLRMEY